MAPQLAPFTFGDEAANAGEMATVQCAVIKGDLPIEVAWSFNGRAINANGAFDEHNYDNPDIVISRNSKRASALTIESVAARHAGEYTCTASNTAGTATHSSILSVNGTPMFEQQIWVVGWLVGRAHYLLWYVTNYPPIILITRYITTKNYLPQIIIQHLDVVIELHSFENNVTRFMIYIIRTFPAGIFL